MEAKTAILVALSCILAISTLAAIFLFLKASSERDSALSELSNTKTALNSSQRQLVEARAELENRMEEIERQKGDISALGQELNASRAETRSLMRRLNETEAELEETRDTLAEASDEISRIREEALEMDEQINESIAWFKDNAELPETLKADRFVNHVEKSCVGDSTLRLACVSYLMKEDLGFMYKDDPTGDRLYSIEEIITRRGGDCEDYSLFYKALLNRFEGEDLSLEAWTTGTGRYVIYEDTSTGRYWYYDDSDGITLGNAKVEKPYVACYFYGMEGETRVGHCIIMLANSTIDSPDDITNKKLDGAMLFEPQDGQYMGSIGDEYTVCEEGDETCDMEDYSLTFIITDSDLFEFSGGEWDYYAGSHEDIGTLIARLDGISLG